MGETTASANAPRGPSVLSVSSNGSTWVKPLATIARDLGKSAFSILERIDVGETASPKDTCSQVQSLSVSSNGSTWVKREDACILNDDVYLSVSSNGSTWVKHLLEQPALVNPPPFQYPRTDRRG